MHFHCLDSAGHAAVDVKLRGDACRAMGKMESAAFRICLEAAAIDSFVAHIQKMEKVSGATIYLPMAS